MTNRQVVSNNDYDAHLSRIGMREDKWCSWYSSHFAVCDDWVERGPYENPKIFCLARWIKNADDR